MSAARIIIRHVRGSNANREYQFPVDAYTQLTIGRDPSSTIQFDAVNDDEVSRRHAVITVTPGDPPTFRLNDLQSTNGTLRNGKTISGETELRPGDEIELGAGGPKFVFDMDPRPAGHVDSTRLMSSAGPAHTRAMNTGAGASAAGASSSAGKSSASADTNAFAATSSPAAKSGVGRTTLMHLLSSERQSVTRKAIYAVAGLLVVVLVVGGAIYYINEKHVQQEQAARAAALAQQKAEQLAKEQAAKEEQAKHDAEAKQRADNIAKDVGVTPDKIAATYGESTVKIYTGWRLYDKASGKPLYHKMLKTPNGLVLVYVRMPNGDLVRWLTTDDEDGQNPAIGFHGWGSGFVVKSDGFILTNKHVAASWKTPFEFGDYEQGKAIVLDAVMQRPTNKKELQVALNIVKQSLHNFNQHAPGRDSKQLSEWVPEGKGYVFDSDLPVPMDPRGQLLEGHSDMLEVQFPGNNTTRYRAELVNWSGADMAMIKIAAPATLHPVELADSTRVALGEHIIVLGYPGISLQQYRSNLTEASGSLARVTEEIAKPTVTDGIVSNIGAPLRQEGGSITGSTEGDVYQLSDLATGQGNSGGPVFNSQGQVIGMFTSETIDGIERATYAVPISYGLALMQVQH